jgi:hypothetical protein
MYDFSIVDNKLVFTANLFNEPGDISSYRKWTTSANAKYNTGWNMLSFMYDGGNLGISLM